MAQTESTVTSSVSGGRHLPDFVRIFAVVLDALRGAGVLAELPERVRWNRQGGFHPMDIVVFLLGYFLSGGGRKSVAGMGEFSDRVGGWRRELAALAGREEFATQSSVSRALATAKRCDLNAAGRWMLGVGSLLAPLLRDPASMYRDGAGRCWCVLDYDPSIVPFRKRGLPDATELPEAILRAAQMGAPGYSGRQRGEVQLAVHVLQHAGAGVFGYVDLEAGNPHCTEKATEICLAALEMARLAGVAASQTLVRADGGGDVTALMAKFLEHRLVPLVRMSRYALLESEPAATIMKTSVWIAVPDARSGPHREAMDLGDYTLQPRGTEHDPLGPSATIRLVVSRFAAETKHGAGHLMDGYHYEMFGTGLPADGWTAPEVVQCYFGRAAIENRFAQLNREVKVLRLHSLDLAGQRLAMMVGLWAFNLKTALGYRLVEPTGGLPPQQPAVPGTAPAKADVPTAGRDDVPTGAVVEQPPLPSPPPCALGTAGTEQPANIPATAPASSAPAEPPTDAVPGKTGAKPMMQQTIREAIARLPWARVLRKHPGWSWKDQELRCPQGNVATFHGVILQGHHKHARFGIAAVHCDGCPRRSQCTQSTKPSYTRTINVPGADELPVGMRLGKRARNPAWSASALNQRLRPPQPTPAAPYQVAAPQIVPTVLRQNLCKLIELTRVEVHAPRSPKPTQPPEHLAATPARRQRRRQDWPERLQRNARTAPTRVDFTVWARAGRCQADRLRKILKS